MYGVYLKGRLMCEFDSAYEAYSAAVFALDNTGLFHEVMAVY